MSTDTAGARAGDATGTRGLEELAAVLGRERLLLELLLFKLVSLSQLLLAGEVRFLGWASEEVERAVAKVRHAELQRSVLVSELSAGTAGEELTLRRLAEDAPEPWRTVFADHRKGFLSLATEVEEALATARRLSAAGGTAVSGLLERLSGEITGSTAMPPGAAVTTAGTYGPGATFEPAGRVISPRISRTL